MDSDINLIKAPSYWLTSLTSLSINATGSQLGLSSQPRFIEVANPSEQPYSGIKRPEAQHQPISQAVTKSIGHKSATPGARI